jgi:hypothetical protein
MYKPPFKKFILTFLLFNKTIPFIIDKLKEFGYFIDEKEVSGIFTEMKNYLPPSIIELLNSRAAFDINNESHIEWLKYFEIFEFYDFIIRRDSAKDPPEYFKWCSDCLWVHSYKDVMCLINILLFNDESLDEISKIIMFKYKKKIGVDALLLYKTMFWNTDSMTAKEALYYCIPFRQNTLIIRKLRSGDSELLTISADLDSGSDLPITFHDTNYIKWKIGYRDVVAPTAHDFIEQIKRDSYFKYYETMSMTQCADTSSEEGTNDEFGAFSKSSTTKKNVEEQRVKLAKSWIDIYMKANEAMPVGGGETKDFFEKMQQVCLDFGEPEDEKIARIEDIPGVLNDVKGDLSS